MKIRLGGIRTTVLLAIIILGGCQSVFAQEGLVLSLPEISWAMKVKAAGFALDQRHNEPGGIAYFMASNKSTEVILSGRIEKAGKVGTAKDAREYFWENTKKMPFKIDDIKLSESGQIAMVEYTIKEHMGIPVNQKNLWGYYAKDQYWMNLHVSKTNPRPGEEMPLKQILEGVTFEEKLAGRKIETRYRVNDENVIILEVPEKWSVEIERPADFPPTIILKPDKMPAMAIHVTPMWNPGKESDFNSSARILKILQDGGNKLLPEAVEKELTFRELKGKSGLGYFFTITDKAPSIKPGEYKYMTQGGIPVGSLLVMFTILYNGKDSVDVPIAREIIANAIQK